MIDKNKLKEKIQKIPNKDILYLTVNPVESKSLQMIFKEIENKIKNKKSSIVVLLS